MISQENNKKKRRNRLYIFKDILEVAKDKKIKTHIMYKAGLSFSQIEEYLPFLIERGLLTERDGFYQTAPRGIKFLGSFQKALGYLQPEGSSLTQPSISNGNGRYTINRTHT